VVAVWVKFGVKDDFSQELNMSQNQSKPWAMIHEK
jgi:hypothetical protein